MIVPYSTKVIKAVNTKTGKEYFCPVQVINGQNVYEVRNGNLVSFPTKEEAEEYLQD